MQGSRPRPEPSGVAAAVSVSGAPFEVTTDTRSPLAAPSPGDRPVIDFHGTADPIIGFELAQTPCSQAAAAGVRCDLVPYEGIGHRGIDPQYVSLLEDIETRTVEFIAEVVLTPLGYMGQPPGDPPPTPADPDQPSPTPAQQASPAFAVVGDPTFTG